METRNRFNAEAADDDLLATTRITNPVAADRTVARIHAQAAVSQSVSLAIIADALSGLLATLAPQTAAGDPLEEAGYDRANATLEFKVGDVVTVGDSGVEHYVDEVGQAEGDQWAVLIDEDGSRGHHGRIWSRYLTFVRHESAATDTTGPDADFETPSDSDEAAEVDKADAFAAARKATGKGKKGGKS